MTQLDSVEILLEGINPIPWSVPNLGRGHAFSATLLRDYKTAIRESIAEAYPDHPTFEKGALLTVEMWFSRCTSHGAQDADATNLFKSTEDALQVYKSIGFRGLFHNDTHNRRICGEIVCQDAIAPELILIKISRWTNYSLHIFNAAKARLQPGPAIPGNVRLEYKEK